MVLYAAADRPLRTIAAGSPPPPLSVRELEPERQAVRVHFTKPHVYRVGAHTGCSCGFVYGDGDDADEDAAGRESVRRLGAYLASALGAAGTVELYACWDGDEPEPEAARAVVVPADFTGDAPRFELPERWLATVRARAD
jgi:hypothetical protein